MNPSPEKLRHPSLNGVTLNTLHWGDRERPVIVLLHGGGANAHWWDHIAPSLAQSHYVVALDFRGHGDSDSPEELLVGAFNADLEALCDDLPDPNPTLIGHSMGAAVALDHASRFAQTKRLVLIDPARGSNKRSSRAARLALSLARTYSGREEAIERFRFVPSADKVSEPLRRHIASHSVQRESDGQWGFKFDRRWFGVSTRPRPDPADVQCTTLVVRGAQSRLLSHQAAQELCGELQRGRCIEIPSAGHHVLLDNPQALIDALMDFFP